MSRDYDCHCDKCNSNAARRLGVYDYYIYQCQVCGAGWFVLMKDIPTKAHGTDDNAWHQIASEVYQRVEKEKKKIGIEVKQ